MNEEKSSFNKAEVSNTLKNLDSGLSKADLDRAIELSKQIDVSDDNSIINFGVDTQRNLGDATSKLLKKTKTSKSGEAGQLLGELVMHVNSYDVQQTGFEKVLTTFGLGKLVNHAKKIITAHESVEENLLSIQEKLEDSRMNLIGENANIENLYNDQVAYLRDNKLNIEAIRIKQREIQKELLPELEKKISEATNDVEKNILIQEKSGLTKFFISLDKKALNLASVNTSTFQSLPRLELVKSGNVELVSNIQDVILNVLPMWRGNILEALQLQQQKELSDTMRNVKDLTNKLILNNAKSTKENMLQIAKESNRAVIDIETLEASNKEFISTLKGIIEIEKDSYKNRNKAAESLKRIESELIESVENVQKGMVNATDISMKGTKVDISYEVVDDRGANVKVEPLFKKTSNENENA